MKLYPTGLSPGKFYRTAKIHKQSANQGVEKLHLQPIVLDINTATFELARYLAKTLSLLSCSEFTV